MRKDLSLVTETPEAAKEQTLRSEGHHFYWRPMELISLGYEAKVRIRETGPAVVHPLQAGGASPGSAALQLCSSAAPHPDLLERSCQQLGLLMASQESYH